MPLIDHHPTEVVIVGGGVEGCSIAWHLAQSGAKVTLLERWQIAAAASGASAGGVRHQGRDFREFPLAFRAIERWLTLEDELAANVDYRRGGHATVTEHLDDLPVLAASVRAQQIAGLSIEVVQGDDLRTLIPGISPNALAAAWSPNDGHANPTATTRAFATAARRAGATVREGVAVTGLVHEHDRVSGVATDQGLIAADIVVLAAGAWSNELASGIGVDLHCSADAYQAITTFPVEPHLVQVLGSMHRLISLKQLPDGRYLLGGGWPGDFTLRNPRGTTREANIIANQEEAIALIPDVARAVIDQAWIGIDNHGHDDVPVLGLVDGVEGLVVATGFSGHGFALAPAVGEAIAGLITTGTSPIDISLLSLSRFTEATDESTTDHAG
ncbi:MAG TPA: FAD-binding oxidoreductase [Thermomicrobiales bacterium]|nr:FAD-binding oxidoreductase [Thermomicrobiales bacterium]